MKIDELKSLLARFHIRPDKRLGQNFLLSDKALEEIVEASELDLKDTILEIGPGLGVLTEKLGERAGLVLAIEKDFKLAEILRKMFKNKKNIKVIRDDALFFKPETYHLGTFSYKLVANIPYYITGKLLQNFLTSEAKPSLMVLLLQKEVAERMVAGAGDMSILSVSTQFYSEPEIVARVPRDEFYPAPEVDSAVVRLKVFEKPRFAVDEKKFFRLIKMGFAGKRKQLHNNLTSGLGKDKDYKVVLENLNINPLARAQDLSMEQWHELYKVLVDES